MTTSLPSRGFLRIRTYLLLLVLLVLPFDTASGASKKEWKVVQQMNGYSWCKGSTEISIGAEGFRFDNIDRNPPQKFVILINKNDKTISSFNEQCKDRLTIDYWLKTLEGRTASRYTHGAHWAPKEKSIIAGVESREYEASNTHNNEKYVAHVWVAEQIPIPPQTSKLWSLLTGAPDLRQLPLKFYIEDERGRRIRSLDTTSVSTAHFGTKKFVEPQLRWAKALSPPMLADPGTL